MELNEVQTRTATVRMEPAGFLRLTMLPRVEETLADAQENVDAGMSLQHGQRLPILVDIRRMKAQTREARMYYMGPLAQQSANAVALLAEGRVSTMIANFIITIAQPSMPTKLFTSEAEAIAWLQGFRP